MYIIYVSHLPKGCTPFCNDGLWDIQGQFFSDIS